MTNFFAKKHAASKAKTDEVAAAVAEDAQPAPVEKKIAGASLFGKKAAEANVPMSPSGSSADKLQDAFARKNLAKENDILDGLTLPEPPPVDATPEVLLTYQLDKLAVVINHPIASRDTLAALHDQLKSNPQLKELLLPEHLGNITKSMGILTQTAHGRAVAKKTTAQKKVVAKEAKAKEVDELADEFAGMM